jgi:hypothetical protein
LSSLVALYSKLKNKHSPARMGIVSAELLRKSTFPEKGSFHVEDVGACIVKFGMSRLLLTQINWLFAHSKTPGSFVYKCTPLSFVRDDKSSEGKLGIAL